MPTLFPLPTFNSKLEGRIDTEVLFVRKRFQIHGLIVEGVFPVFEGVKIRLPDYCMSDPFWEKFGKNSYAEQMRTASAELSMQIQVSPSLAKIFTEEQLRAIHARKSIIPQLTWHHTEEWLTMQLVDSRLHNLYKHTGGSYTWNIKHFISST